MNRVDLKVVLLGKEYSGKTCLVTRYVNQQYLGDDIQQKYQATIGAAFAAKYLDVRGKRLVMGIWDTAGSERYYGMSRMYYRDAKAAIVCYDLTDSTSWERVKFWVDELRSQEEGCKIYLCGTKKDLITDGPVVRQVDYRTTADYANSIPCELVETSSKTGENVDTLFQKIVEDFISLPKNMRQIEESIRLEAQDQRMGCCS